jgi:hypothetical protein
LATHDSFHESALTRASRVVAIDRFASDADEAGFFASSEHTLRVRDVLSGLTA